MTETDDHLLRLVEQGIVRHEPGEQDIATAVSDWLRDAQLHFSKQLARAAEPTPATTSTSRSLLAAVLAARVRRRALGQSSDLRALTAAARGASLLEKRTALLRLSELAQDDEDILDDLDLSYSSQEPELERDLLQLQAKRSGAAGRSARNELAEVAAELNVLSKAVARVVDGTDAGDAFSKLKTAERARVALHLRDADDSTSAFLLDRLGELLDQADGAEAVERIAALRPSADPRTLPMLASALLDDPRSDVRTEAIRALARIDDRRVVGLLTAADTRASDLAERLAIAEGLALWGDFRGSDCIREALGDARESTRLAALDSIWDPALAELAFAQMQQPEVELRRSALRAIGRAGDERALLWLDSLDADPALSTEVEAARDSTLARLEMRGDAPEDLAKRTERPKTPRALARAPGAAPTKRHRFGAFLLVIKSWILRALGMREASSVALDRAQDADPSWPTPGLLQGNLWLTAGNLSRAVAGYRRALSSFSDALARNAGAMTRIARTYLERTDELLAEGRTEAARALIDELMLSNLSGVASHVRHAARRRRRKLIRALPPAKAGE